MIIKGNDADADANQQMISGTIWLVILKRGFIYLENLKGTEKTVWFQQLFSAITTLKRDFIKHVSGITSL